jgi:hypothetical protein
VLGKSTRNKIRNCQGVTINVSHSGKPRQRSPGRGTRSAPSQGRGAGARSRPARGRLPRPGMAIGTARRVAVPEPGPRPASARLPRPGNAIDAVRSAVVPEFGRGPLARACRGLRTRSAPSAGSRCRIAGVSVEARCRQLSSRSDRFRIRHRPFRLGDGNRSICPISDLRADGFERLCWVASRHSSKQRRVAEVAPIPDPPARDPNQKVRPKPVLQPSWDFGPS